MNVLASTSFIGTTGFANHAQSFLTSLDKLTPIKVRNSTIGNSWKGYSLNSHDKESYITNQMKNMLILQLFQYVRVYQPSLLLSLFSHFLIFLIYVLTHFQFGILVSSLVLFFFR